MYFQEDEPYKRDLTRQFWKEILPDFDVYISDMVIREIMAIPDDILRETTLRLARNFNILEEVPEIRELSDLYLSRRRLPRADAIHLAFASFYGMYYFATWNRRHLYRRGTQEMLWEVNVRLKLSIPIIVTPEDFFEEV